MTRKFIYFINPISGTKGKVLMLDMIKKRTLEKNIPFEILHTNAEGNYNYVKEILPNAEIYVYVLKENIVGFIGINENYIEGIFIDTNNQCKGIGTSLLNKVKENRDNLTLSVYKKNINAINFYKKNDFIITSENIDKDTAEIEYTMTWNK